MSLPVVACHDRPSRGSWLWLRLSPNFARLRLACMVHNMPSPMAAYPSRQFDKYDKFETEKKTSGVVHLFDEFVI
ncbi:MAG: hypothetical protein PUE80_00740 [bacterium]|nr:hypothetical protein [bacterium]